MEDTKKVEGVINDAEAGMDGLKQVAQE